MADDARELRLPGDWEQRPLGARAAACHSAAAHKTTRVLLEKPPGGLGCLCCRQLATDGGYECFAGRLEAFDSVAPHFNPQSPRIRPEPYFSLTTNSTGFAVARFAGV